MCAVADRARSQQIGVGQCGCCQPSSFSAASDRAAVADRARSEQLGDSACVVDRAQSL